MSLNANDNSGIGVHDDLIQPFQLDKTNFRGRIVRLNGVLNEILSAHQYPKSVARLLAEALGLTTLLAAMLKFEGIFTLQASSKGLIKTLVCDMTSEGEIRGYAGFDEEDIDAINALGDEATVGDLMGDGYLAFTVDHKLADRYQGIVELQPTSIQDSVLHYFDQSEQIKTSIQVAIDEKENGEWIAGSIMVQKLPEETKIQLVDKDDWTRTQMLMQTITKEELTDSSLTMNDLLYRLFHEEGVRVFPTHTLKKGCRCNTEKVMNVLRTLTPDDLDHAAKDGRVDMTCQFCSKEFSFSREEISSHFSEEQKD